MKRLILVLMMAASPALASEEGPFFSLHNAEFIVTLAFIVFVGLLIYLGVPGRITRLLDDRAQMIRNDLDEARLLKDEARALLASYEAKQLEMQAQSARIIKGDMAHDLRTLDVKAGGREKVAQTLIDGDPEVDIESFGLKFAPSFGTGPILRGRLDRPSILVLADQQSHDDLFTMRALTGDDGQHLQAFLRAGGLTSRYAILRVLPIDTMADDQTAVAAAVDSAPVRALYAEAVRVSRPQVLLFVGPLAQRLQTHVTPMGIPTVTMKSRVQSGVDVSWQAALTQLQGLTYRRDITTPTFTYAGEREQIPRQDLPFGTLHWQASSGNRGQQAQHSGAPSFDYYKVTMPAWAAALSAPPLSASEAAAAQILRNL